MPKIALGVLLLWFSALLLPLPGLTHTKAAATAPSGGLRAAGGNCPALPPPTGTIVDVASVAGLQKAVNTATPNTTIRIADGSYDLNGAYLRIDVPNVTLRSASGNRQGVVLDGNYVTTEIVQVVASNVTIADLTLREALYHPIHVMSTGGAATLDTLIYNVHIIDPGQQAIKINPVAGGVLYRRRRDRLFAHRTDRCRAGPRVADQWLLLHRGRGCTPGPGLGCA